MDDDNDDLDDDENDDEEEEEGRKEGRGLSCRTRVLERAAPSPPRACANDTQLVLVRLSNGRDPRPRIHHHNTNPRVRNCVM